MTARIVVVTGAFGALGRAVAAKAAAEGARVAALDYADSPPAGLARPERYREGGYIRRLPQDPWGNDYLLVSPGEHGAVDVFSAGPDGEANTADDITNWSLDKKEK